MDPIDIVVPLRSDEQRLLHEFKEATIGPSPLRLVAGDHVGEWSIRPAVSIEWGNVRYSLFFSNRHPNPASANPTT